MANVGIFTATETRFAGAGRPVNISSTRLVRFQTCVGVTDNASIDSPINPSISYHLLHQLNDRLIQRNIGSVYPMGVVVGGLRTSEGVGGGTWYTDDETEPGIW